MHPSSLEEMGRFAASLDRDSPLVVGDVGASDFNGSYRALFEHWEYQGIDPAPGPNVDIVVSGPYRWRNIRDGTYDVVISGQVLEHVPQPWRWMAEIARIAKPGASICIIAPHTARFHEHPVDCWRIWPDGMRGLFRHAGIVEVDVHRNETYDTVGIGVKQT